MRILVVGNLYPPIVFGGYEILCERVVRSLERRGHEVHVLTSDFMAEQAPPDPRVTRSLGLTTDFPRPGETVGTVDFSARSLHRIGRRNYERTREAICRVQPDLVFAWCMNRLSLGPFFAARDLGIPACYTINDEHPRQYSHERPGLGLLRMARHLAQRFVWPMATLAHLEPPPMTIISEALRQRLLTLGVPVEDALVLHQGIPVRETAFRPRARHAGAPLRVMYAGQLSRVKGVHTIIGALGRLRSAGRRDIHLDIIGDGVPDYLAHLRARAAELGVADRVTFVGRLSHEQVEQAYHEHHVLVFSSEWEEPFGLVHLEAMAAGCTVISTTTGGSAELIRDCMNALAYKAGSADDLARQLRRLLEDDGLRLELAEGGRAWVLAHHEFEDYVDRLEGWVQGGARAPWLEPTHAGSGVGSPPDRLLLRGSPLIRMVSPN